MIKRMVGEHLQREVKITQPLHRFRKNKSSPTQFISFERVTRWIDEEDAIPTVYLEFKKNSLMILLGQYVEMHKDKCGQIFNQLNDYTQKGSVLMSLDQI